MAQQIIPVADSPQRPGGEFTVEIRVERVKNLFGISFVLHYTFTHFISIVSVEKGDFLGNDVIFFHVRDEEKGTVSAGITRKRPAGGVDGSGVVAKVTLRSTEITPDDTSVNLTITDITANNPEGIAMPLPTRPMKVIITDEMPSPAEISILTAVQVGRGNLIVWRTASGIDNVGFNIYRHTAKDGNGVKIGRVDGVGNQGTDQTYRFIDRTAQPGRTYFYFIESIDAFGNQNTSARVRTSDAVVPLLPIKATVSKRGVVITWATDGKEIFLYRALKASGPYQILAKLKEKMYEDTSVTGGQTYFYFIQGAGPKGQSVWSEAVSIGGLR